MEVFDMKNYKGVITVEYGKSFMNRLTSLMNRMKLFKVDGYYTITDNTTDEEIGAFVCVNGFKPVVKFLEWITDYRGKDSKTVTIEY
jgi:hypothetical protein